MADAPRYRPERSGRPLPWSLLALLLLVGAALGVRALWPAPAEVRRLVAWFDDKFHHEVTANLVYERVNKKVMRGGYPDGKAVKTGAQKIKFHLDYMTWLLDHRRWLAGDSLTLADFTAAAHLSCLDYISDVDWNRSAVVKDWYAKIKSRPAFRSILADQIPGFIQPPHYANLDF